MRRTFSLVTFALLLSVAGVATAGERHQPCDLSNQECVNKTVAKLQKKAWLGIEVDKNDHGWYKVTAVTAGSPAEAAGFQKGDVLLTLNGAKVHPDNKAELKKAKQALAPGKSAEYVVKRAGGKQTINVTLGNVPPTLIAQWLGEQVLERHEIQIAAK